MEALYFEMFHMVITMLTKIFLPLCVMCSVFLLCIYTGSHEIEKTGRQYLMDILLQSTNIELSCIFGIII